MKIWINYLTVWLLIVTIGFGLGCKPKYKVIEYNSTNEIVLTDFSTPDSSFRFVDTYKNLLETQMNEVINTTNIDLEIGNPEGLLGNVFADFIHQKAQSIYKSSIDFTLLNNGGLRKPLLKGPITRGDIYEVMPFENEIVLIEISGEKVAELIDYIHKKVTIEKNAKAGVAVSGIRLVMTEHEVIESRIGLYKFNPTKTYKIATSDYLAQGGDQMYFLENPLSTYPLNIKIRDALLQSIEELGKKGIAINAELDGRIRLQ